MHFVVSFSWFGLLIDLIWVEIYDWLYLVFKWLFVWFIVVTREFGVV